MSAEKENPCCPPSRVPKLEKSIEGKGRFVKIPYKAGEVVDCYVTGDEKSKKCLFVQADIFGLKTGRHVHLCDFYAEEGYFVVMPDGFKGKGFSGDLSKDIPQFLKDHPVQEVLAINDKAYEHFKLSSKEKVHMIGFCYGVWIEAHESKSKVFPNLKALAGYHPTIQLEKFNGGNYEELYSSRHHPFLLFPTKDDPVEFGDGGALEKDHGYTVIDFRQQNHGFMTQGDAENDEAMKNDIARALQETLKFFSKY